MLNSTKPAPNGSPLFFGGVRVGKNCVRLHLMPVYAAPVLLEGLSPELLARMQGKSCFNFKTLDQLPLGEVKTLVRRSFALFKKVGWI